ncbi:ATP-dependent DNA helicase RecG [Ananas comosus]|uniref:DNA 3'-5' helicase n=1 Tax=Ananas comosus TaxID=4615 RepID=A0A199VJ04_ANACO|nr:ATP-dependent DNA helicase RecG [Ananas comosus]
MAQFVTESLIQACCRLKCIPRNGLNESRLASAISLEVASGYQNTFGRTMRFSSFLHSKLSKWYSRSDHLSAQKLLEEVNGYGTASMSERSKFLNKVSVLMGYSNIQDLIEQERIRKETESDLIANDEFDFSFNFANFPCIKLGDSSFIELYDEFPTTEHGEKLSLPNSGKLVEAWNWLRTSFTSINTLSSSEEVSSINPYHSQEALVAKEIVSHKPSSEVSGSDAPILDKNIRCLPGTTSRQCRQLEESGFHTVRKLLHHFPRTYADLQNAQGPIDDGHYLMFVGTILSSKGIKASSSFAFLEVVVACELLNCESTSEVTGDNCDAEEKKMVYLHLKKFFRGSRFTYQPFLRSIESKYKEGDHVYVSGKVKKMRSKGHYEMREYSIDMLEEEEEHHAQLERRPYPLYPSKAGLKQSFLGDVISRALKILNSDIDPIPSEILAEFNLLNLFDAYTGIHRPNNLAEADLARRRLIFDDFFYLQLGRLYQMLEALGTRIEKEELLGKYKLHELNAACVEDWSPLTQRLLKALPYSLTPSQLNAVSEIIWDLKRPVPMNRLLQGDVGCGKTVVAFLACMEVIGSGFQAAFMVPTELLAIQHYEHLNSLLEGMEGGEGKPNGLQLGDLDMVVGTHSLISEKIEYSALRIAVIDEQHRFGVIQRGRFNSKLYSSPSCWKNDCTNLEEISKEKAHMAPHILAISATPIPRTLALALYGDMSLTQITDLPPGRKPIETLALEGNEIGFEKVYQMMREELISGGKVYLVYPIIQESEQLPQLRAATADFSSISGKFEDYKCGLLHGRMSGEEKENALRDFKSGGTRILLATQVIEIGVDVPDASMMVVVNAERFGIAQLHQLRGRVGRGERKSRCVFLSSTSGSVARLKVLEKSCDGFYLANADLLLRGPGNLLGKKQSGHLPEFPIARLEIDGNILQEAQLAALEVLARSHDLELYPKLKAELSMRQPLCILGD